ncbi:MAG: hypothetical protein LZF86_100202 [Nitrospira sp.]|nr:MAG: hypothetical protein LZF86_100202 [Nitrospira sp.]
MFGRLLLFLKQVSAQGTQKFLEAIAAFLPPSDRVEYSGRVSCEYSLLSAGVLLTHSCHGPSLVMWGELTPRGNMVHKGVECESGVHDQLVLGSLMLSRDLRRTC